MQIGDFLARREDPFFSFELIPPARGTCISDVYELVDCLMPHRPAWIDVTNHAADSWFEELPDGSWRRHIVRKRPGTLGLCAAIKYRYNIETVPHILCQGFTREETEDALIELSYLDIRNLLVVRGDNVDWKVVRPGRRNQHALDLVVQVMDMNRGQYMHEMVSSSPTSFCVGVAGYPEKHYESPSISYDLKHLKAKVDAGAAYIVTQMFFENEHYFRFVDRCREAGIQVPVIPGLKVLDRKSQLTRLPRNFYIAMPEGLVSEVLETKKAEQVQEIGCRHAQSQVRGLLEGGAPGIHFFVTSDAPQVARVLEGL